MSMRVFVLLLFLVSVSYCSFTETVYTASLSNNQEVPIPLDPPPTSGTAVCTLLRDQNPQIFDCEVQHNVENVVGVHIHVGARGSNGPLIYQFTQFSSSNIRESFRIEDLEEYPREQQSQDFLKGLWYINIHSEEYPSGEIRGQIEHTDRFYSRLSFRNTIPHASGTSAHGVAIGGFDIPKREMTMDLVHSCQQPLKEGIEVRKGGPGDVGPLVYTFASAESPIYDSVKYTINEEAEFFQDLHYLNVLSVNNPSGEIRGQIVTIDYIDELSFTSRLSASEAIPETDSNNRGSGLFAYDCDTKVLEYILMHNVPDSTGAFIGSAPSGEQGTTLFSLGSGVSPIYGSVQLSPQEELLLYSRLLYVIVTSPDFPLGEIRGQITVDFDWWAYLSGTNVVSPITTPAVGVATMVLLGEQSRRVDYSIFHSVEFPLRATLNVAREGESGPLDLVFPSVFSPIRGNDIVLDDDELEAFVTEGMYISVTSTEYPFLGEIRGQIRRVNPCKASNDNSLTISVSERQILPQDESSEKAASYNLGDENEESFQDISTYFNFQQTQDANSSSILLGVHTLFLGLFFLAVLF